MLASCFTQIRFHTHGKSEHLEEANTRIRAQPDGVSLEDLARPLIIGQLSTLRGLRFNGTDHDHMLSSNLESGKLPTFQDLTASSPNWNLVRVFW
jgi:hypothetical protein